MGISRGDGISLGVDIDRPGALALSESENFLVPVIEVAREDLFATIRSPPTSPPS